MPTPIRLIIEDLTFTGSLNDGPTAAEVVAALPLSGTASRWGEEYYFGIPVRAELEPGAGDVVEPGSLAFWPPGQALCLFWGPTPASQGEECRAASAVNLLGSIEGDLAGLGRLGGSVMVRVEKA